MTFSRSYSQNLWTTFQERIATRPQWKHFIQDKVQVRLTPGQHSLFAMLGHRWIQGELNNRLKLVGLGAGARFPRQTIIQDHGFWGFYVHGRQHTHQLGQRYNNQVKLHAGIEFATRTFKITYDNYVTCPLGQQPIEDYIAANRGFSMTFSSYYWKRITDYGRINPTVFLGGTKLKVFKQGQINTTSALLLLGMGVTWELPRYITLNPAITNDGVSIGVGIRFSKPRYRKMDLPVQGFNDIPQFYESNYYQPTLHSAVENQDVDAVREILIANPSLDAKDARSCTALYYAIEKNNHTITDLLIQAGAKLDEKNGSHGRTPLHLAIRCGHTEMVTRLINAKAPVNALDNNGNTPLHCASGRGNAPLVQSLLRAGSAVNIRNLNHWTPLALALRELEPKGVKYLLEGGAQFDFRNDSNKRDFRVFSNQHFPYWEKESQKEKLICLKQLIVVGTQSQNPQIHENAFKFDSRLRQFYEEYHHVKDHAFISADLAFSHAMTRSSMQQPWSTLQLTDIILKRGIQIAYYFKEYERQRQAPLFEGSHKTAASSLEWYRCTPAELRRLRTISNKQLMINKIVSGHKRSDEEKVLTPLPNLPPELVQKIQYLSLQQELHDSFFTYLYRFHYLWLSQENTRKLLEWFLIDETIHLRQDRKELLDFLENRFDPDFIEMKARLGR